MAIDPKWIDELLTNYKRPEDIIGENGLLKQLTKAVFSDAASAADPLDLPAIAGFGPDDAAKGAATALATKHIVERGLVVPLRSSIVRNILSWGETAATAAVLIPLNYQLSVGVKAEYDARKARTCRTAWESK